MVRSLAVSSAQATVSWERLPHDFGREALRVAAAGP